MKISKLIFTNQNSMKKVCKLLIFTLLPQLAAAQYEKILNDPDIIWAAELDLTFRLRATNEDTVPPNDIFFWKNFDPKNPDLPRADGELLIEKMFAAADAGEWTAWHLGDSSYQILPKDFFDLHDTMIVYDVETLEESVQAVSNKFYPTEFDDLRVRQLLFFDEKLGEFGLHTFAVAPVMTKYNFRILETGGTEQDLLFNYIPFWLKLPEFSKKKSRQQPSVNDPDILWAAQLKTRGISPELEKLRTLKDFKPPVMQRLLDRFTNDPKYAATDPLGTPMTFLERKNLCFDRDTVITFDPETYEEKITVANRDIKIERVKRLRLVQNWFWDERKKRLVIRLEKFAPLLEVEWMEGRFSYDLPIFYRRL